MCDESLFLPFPKTRRSKTLSCKQVSQRPNVSGDTAFHRGRTTDRRMNPAKVVVRKVQRERRFQVFPLLTKTKTQPRESSHRGSDIQVLSFNV